MTLPSPPSQLRNVFAGYYLLLFNYLVKLVAAIVATTGKPWNVRFVTHADSPVTAAVGDFLVCNTVGGAISVTGPATINATWGVAKVNADAPAVSVAASVGNVNGLAAQSIGFQWGSLTMVGTGTGCIIASSN